MPAKRPAYGLRVEQQLHSGAERGQVFVQQSTACGGEQGWQLHGLPEEAIGCGVAGEQPGRGHLNRLADRLLLVLVEWMVHQHDQVAVGIGPLFHAAEGTTHRDGCHGW